MNTYYIIINEAGEFFLTLDPGTIDREKYKVIKIRNDDREENVFNMLFQY